MVRRKMYLCGGGIKAFAHLGALEVLEAAGQLRFVKEWMGVSAGGFLALSMALRFSLSELRDFYLKFELSSLMDADTVPGWLFHLGFDTGNKLQRLVEAFLHQKGLTSHATFADMAAAGFLAFRTWATDINTGTLIEFSAAKTPTYSVSHAIRATMSLPYYFQPFTCPVSGHSLCDGGILSNYPLRYLSAEDLEETLGIQMQTRTGHVEDVDIQGFLMRPLRLLMAEHNVLEARGYEQQTLTIHMDIVNVVDLNITMEEKMRLMNIGRDAAIHHIQTSRRPVRRYSVS